MNQDFPQSKILFCQHCFNMFPYEAAHMGESETGAGSNFFCPHCNHDELKVIQPDQYDLWCELTWLRKKQNAIRNIFQTMMEVLDQINHCYNKQELDKNYYRQIIADSIHQNDGDE